MNPRQEGRDSAASKRSRHPVSLEPAAALHCDTWADPRPRDVPPRPECPLGTAAPSRGQVCPTLAPMADGAGVWGSRGACRSVGLWSEAGAWLLPKGAQKERPESQCPKSGLDASGLCFPPLGVGVTCQAPGAEGGTLESAPASGPACPVRKPAWHMGRWTGSIWGPWGTPGAGGAREAGGLSARMTGCPPNQS